MEENKSYNEEITKMAKDDSTLDYSVTIPVTIPTMGGYTMEGLKRELTAFALRLVMPGSQEKKSKGQYSQRLLHLRSMSHNNLTALDIDSDERLKYLMNK